MWWHKSEISEKIKSIQDNEVKRSSNNARRLSIHWCISTFTSGKSESLKVFSVLILSQWWCWWYLKSYLDLLDFVSTSWHASGQHIVLVGYRAVAVSICNKKIGKCLKVFKYIFIFHLHWMKGCKMQSMVLATSFYPILWAIICFGVIFLAVALINKGLIAYGVCGVCVSVFW